MENLQTIETPKSSKSSYLRFKTITSQDVSSEAQVKIFFNLQKMSTIKNGQIWLYCNFNKIIKRT